MVVGVHGRLGLHACLEMEPYVVLKHVTALSATTDAAGRHVGYIRVIYNIRWDKSLISKHRVTFVDTASCSVNIIQFDIWSYHPIVNQTIVSGSALVGCK